MTIGIGNFARVVVVDPPANPTDAATKGYVDTATAALSLSASGLVRTTVGHDTAVLANNAVGDGTINLGFRTAHALVITSNLQGYLVVYAHAAGRLADMRVFPPTTDPTSTMAVLLEVAFGAGGGTVIISPAVLLHNEEAPTTTVFPYRWINTSSGSAAAHLDSTIVGLQ